MRVRSMLAVLGGLAALIGAWPAAAEEWALAGASPASCWEIELAGLQVKQEVVKS